MVTTFIDYFAKFEVGQGSEDLFAELTVRQPGTADLFATFTLKTGQENLFATFTLKTGQENLFAELMVRQETSVDLFNYFVVRQTDTANLFAEITVRQETSVDLFNYFVVRQTGTPAELFAYFEAQVTKDLKGIFIARQTGTANLFAEIVIRHPDELDLAAEFRVTVEGWEMQGVSAELYKTLGVLS